MITEAPQASGPLSGTVRVPGDKSISHRAVLMASMAQGVSRLTGVLDSADVRSTIAAVTALGATVTPAGDGGRGERVGAGSDGGSAASGGLDLEIRGWGADGPGKPTAAIDCGNSGTTVRLLLGVLAGWDIEVTLTGDESLSRRPMRRVTEPLTTMGATFQTGEGGTLPVTVHGAALRAIRYELPVASAQVKSAVLLAGLRAEGRTTVFEPEACRDHTERMLPGFGVPVGRDAATRTCWVDGPAVPTATDLTVPGDPSSAAFLIGAAAIVPESVVTLAEVALNPTRVGFLCVLEAMGADVGLMVTREAGAEPVGTIVARYRDGLGGTTVEAADIPSLIDEVPLLSVMASQAVGTTRFEGVGELRVKESDRLAAIQDGLTALGAQVRSGPDWLEIDGPAALHGCTLDSLGDHRLAMAWAVAALVADGPVRIERWDAVDVSYPRFAVDLASLSPGSAS